MKRSGGNGEGGAFELLVRARLRIAIAGMVTQYRIADAGKFIGQRAGSLVVIGALRDLGRPSAQAVQRPARIAGQRRSPQCGPGAVQR